MFQSEQTNQLYLKAKVELCDYTQRIYPQPVNGAKVLRKTPANRWEVKMLCGPEYLAQHGIAPQTEAKCMIEIEENGGYLEA